MWGHNNDSIGANAQHLMGGGVDAHLERDTASKIVNGVALISIRGERRRP